MSEPSFKCFSYMTSVTPKSLSLMAECGVTGTNNNYTKFQNSGGPIIAAKPLTEKNNILRKFNNTFVDYVGPGPF